VRNSVARAVLFVEASGREILEGPGKAVGGFGTVPCPIVPRTFCYGFATILKSSLCQGVSLLGEQRGYRGPR
jgi:hypothetical protein